MNDKVAYLGPNGTFSHQAARQITDEPVPYANFSQIVTSVETNEMGIGVLPLENSMEGAVTETMDLLLELNNCYLIGEIVLPIKYELMTNNAQSIGEIKYVTSHPQALAQCKELFYNFPHLEQITANSTAEAAKSASLDSTKAALGPSLCAELYNLHSLWQGPKNQSNNHTRFILIGDQFVEPTGKDRTSICFGTSDTPGGLYSALAPFYEESINLSRIESRPSKRRLGEYIFFLDIHGHVHDTKVNKAISKLNKVATFNKILGSYPKCETAKKIINL